MTIDSGLWCQQRILVTVCGPQTDISQTFDQPYVRVGSHPDSDFVLSGLDETPVRCAYLHATDDGIYAVDLREDAENRFGGWLAEDGEIVIGPYRLSARRLDASDVYGPDGVDLRVKQDSLRRCPKLHVVLNDQVVAKVRLRRRLTVVGNRRPSTLRIINKHISACHCVLYWDGDDVWIVDLLSANRTRIDGRLVQAACLPAGSRLGLHRIALDYIGLSDIEPDPHAATTSEDSDVTLPAAISASVPAGTIGELPTLSDGKLHDSVRRSEELDELQQRLKSQQVELATLHETLRDEREQWQVAMSDRERELEEAAAAVQNAVQSLKTQQRHFEEQNRLQADEVDRKQRQLEERIQAFSVRLQRQEELLTNWEKRMEEGLAEVEKTCRSSGHGPLVGEHNRDFGKPELSTVSPQLAGVQNREFCRNDISTPVAEDPEIASPLAISTDGDGVVSLARDHDAFETEGESSARPGRKSRGMPDDEAVAPSDSSSSGEPDEARLLADKLSFEVCDRLVDRERSAGQRIRRIVAGFVVLAAVAGAVGLYYYQWLR